MPTPLSDSDKVLRNDTGKDMVSQLTAIAQALGVGVDADQINYDNTESGLTADNAQEAIDEVKDITDDLDEKIEDKTSYESTASGSIATFNDGGNNIPLKSCEVAIVATQRGSGAPSPTNVRPITGFSSVNVVDFGINIWDEQWELGQYDINTGDKATNNNAIRSKNFIPIKAEINQKVYFNIPNGVRLYFYDKDKNYLGSSYSFVVNESQEITFTLASAYYFTFYTGNTTTYGNNISINYPSTDTQYHAYTGTTHTIALPKTIYGGTADLVNGNCTKTFGYVDLGDLSWSYAGGTFRAIVTDAITPISGGDTTAICEIYNRVGYSSSIADLSFYLCANQLSASKYLAIRDDSYNGNTTTFKTGVTGKKIIFTLGTPTAFTFTGANIKTLPGTNNIYANCGDISLTYFNQNGNDTADVAKSIHNNNGLHYLSGSIVSIDDGGNDIPLKSCNVQIVAQQEGTGTPSPTNVMAISGFDSVKVAVSNKNLWANGDVTFTGYHSGSIWVENLPIDTYTISLSVTSNDTHANTCLMIVYYTDGTNYPSLQFERNTRVSKTITTTKIVNRIVLYSSDNYSHGSGDTATWSDIQIEKGSTNTVYEVPIITTLPLPETCYGGYGDVTKTNSFVKTYRKLTVTWSDGDGSTDLGNNIRRIFNLPENAVYPPSEGRPQLCDIAPYLANYNTDSCHFYCNSNRLNVFLPEGTAESTEITVIYEVATPTTLSTDSISPKTLSGKNIIYANCGDIDLEYFDSSVDAIAELIKVFTR